MLSVRAACHVHSDWSYDGKWPLEKIAHAFAGRGYRVVMITEHDQGFDESRRRQHRDACRQASSNKILLVPGIEYSDPTNAIHLLVWGDVPFIGTRREPEEILAAAKARDGVVVFAHPSRKNAGASFNPCWKDRIAGIELWNRKTDGWAPSRDAGPLLQTTKALPFVGMDFHDARQFFPLATVLELESPITENTVLDAIRARRCFSMAFGLPATAFSHGAAEMAFHGAESLRRLAALCYRTVRA
jgi:hypothetical protein